MAVRVPGWWKFAPTTRFPQQMTGLRARCERVCWCGDARMSHVSAPVSGLAVVRSAGWTSADHQETDMTTQTGKTAASKSKKARLEGLLGRPRGATIGQLQKALGWQPHTIRAAISRLRKDGIEIGLDRTGKTPAYRIDTAS